MPSSTALAAGRPEAGEPKNQSTFGLEYIHTSTIHLLIPSRLIVDSLLGAGTYLAEGMMSDHGVRLGGVGRD